MEASFWHQRWQENRIGFHQNAANLLLTDHFKALALAKGRRMFVPLCGKTLDIAWLLSHGYRVAGAELSQLAIEQLFAELGLTASISRSGELDHYSAASIDIFVGDIFQLSSQQLGPVHAVYDRAALVALPASMREHYTAHLMDITAKAPQLLICYEYQQNLADENLTPSPPFSISSAEVHQHYQDSYALTLLASTEVAGGLKETCPATEHVWLLQPA